MIKANIKRRQRRVQDKFQARAYLPSGPTYSPPKRQLSTEEFDFIKGYINGMHDNNFVRNPGVPFGPGLDSVRKNTILSTTVSADGNGQILLLVTGHPEAPLIQYKTDSGLWSVWSFPGMPRPDSAANYYSRYPDWMKVHGVEAYRNCGLQVRCDNTTANLYRGGKILAGLSPTGADIVPIVQPSVTYRPSCIRVLESMPTADDVITSMTNNWYSGPADAGLYMTIPVLDARFPYKYRDCPNNKAVYNNGEGTDPNTGYTVMGNSLGVKTGTAGTIYIPPNSVGTSTSAFAGDSICVHPSTNMSYMIRMTGLDKVNTTFNIQVCASWEFLVGVGSDLQDLLHEQVVNNPWVLDLANDIMRTMPGGFPASANFFNELWDKIKEVYRNDVSPIVGRVIKNLPPEYAAIGAGAKSALDMLTEVKKTVKDAERVADKALSATASTAPAMPIQKTSGGSRARN